MAKTRPTQQQTSYGLTDLSNGIDVGIGGIGTRTQTRDSRVTRDMYLWYPEPDW